MPRKRDAEKIKKIIEMFQAGYTPVEIAKAVGLSPTTVRGHLWRAGLSAGEKRRKKFAELREKVIEMAKSGVPGTVVARELSIPSTTVYTWLKQAGIITPRMRVATSVLLGEAAAILRERGVFTSLDLARLREEKRRYSRPPMRKFFDALVKKVPSSTYFVLPNTSFVKIRLFNFDPPLYVAYVDTEEAKAKVSELIASFAKPDVAPEAVAVHLRNHNVPEDIVSAVIKALKSRRQEATSPSSSTSSQA